MENVLVKFKQIYTTCVEMLIDRGFSREVLEKNYLNISAEEFQKLYRKNRLTILAPHNTNKNEHIYTMILGDGVKLKKDVLKKILSGVEKLKEVAESLNKDSKIHLLLLIDDSNTMTALKLVKAHNATSAEKTNIYIESFYHQQMQINITKHKDVPQHILMTKEDVEAMLKEENVTKPQLSRILTTDPVARYFGARKGDVFKIVRPSLSAGQTKTYRLVV
jgi:DNA-directed RNA polymerases I, II, and III subunit RPABC1